MDQRQAPDRRSRSNGCEQKKGEAGAENNADRGANDGPKEWLGDRTPERNTAER